MAREKRTGEPEDATSLELTEVIPVRFSRKVKQEVRARARRVGVSPSVWVRMRILEVLNRKG